MRGKIRKKARSIERLKSRYGMAFVLPFTIGTLLFFILPLLQSILYAFSDTKLVVGGVQTTFNGLENFRYLFFSDPNYINHLMGSITSFLYTFPLTVILSLILALILAKKFRGRTFFRALYFLPVIIASGVVLELLFRSQGSGMTQAGVDQSLMEDMINAEDLLRVLGLPEQINDYFQVVMNNIMSLLWNSGIQIVLFIAGLQSIPDQLYEVSKVEGATAWDEFWFITFPMLSRIIVLVSAFTLVENFTAKTDQVMAQAYTLMQSQNYSHSSAMVWFYFLVISAVVSMLLLIYHRLCLKRWN